MKFVSLLYKIARTANTVSKLSSPTKTARRAKNIAIGRLLNKLGIWR